MTGVTPSLANMIPYRVKSASNIMTPHILKIQLIPDTLVIIRTDKVKHCNTVLLLKTLKMKCNSWSVIIIVS